MPVDRTRLRDDGCVLLNSPMSFGWHNVSLATITMKRAIMTISCKKEKQLKEYLSRFILEFSGVVLRVKIICHFYVFIFFFLVCFLLLLLLLLFCFVLFFFK